MALTFWSGRQTKRNKINTKVGMYAVMNTKQGAIKRRTVQHSGLDGQKQLQEGMYKEIHRSTVHLTK